MTNSAPRTEARWEWMARCIAPLIHDGLLDVPGERQIIDKAFAAAKALDAALPEAEAALPGPVPGECPFCGNTIDVGLPNTAAVP